MSVWCKWLSRLGSLVVLVLFGCGPQTAEPPAVSQTDLSSKSDSEQVLATDIPGYSIDKLTAIDGYLPVLEQGHVQVAPPVDWHLAPRSKRYLVRFVFDRTQRLPLPRITVQVRDATAEEPLDLNTENIHAYIKSLRASLDRESLDAMQDDMTPIKLGDVPCVRYVVAKKFARGNRLIPGLSEVILTIRAGHVYTVSLDVYVGTLVKYRADAYAVMANMKFLAATEQSAADDAASGKLVSGSNAKENE